MINSSKIHELITYSARVPMLVVLEKYANPLENILK